MRSSWNLLVAVAAGLMLAPQLATASDVEEQLRQMQDRMSQLEDKLQAQDDQLDAAERRVEEQQRVIQDAGLNDESAGSALSRFLEQTEFGGVVAASWNWNFNNPSSGATAAANNVLGVTGTGSSNAGLNPGAVGLTAPFHSNSNSFQLDQLLFSMMKPATVESRGGFGIDLAYGASADALSNSGCGDTDDIFGCSGGSNSGDLSFLYQAYAEYLAPIGNGLLVKGGRFETLLGAEVFRADQNLNITRGIVYSMQPTSHTGLLLSGEVASGVTLAAGIANDVTNTTADSDRSKSVLGQIAWSGETAGLAVNGYSGGDVLNPFSAYNGLGGLSGVGRDGDRLSILDVVATWDPSDHLAVWANFDYFWTRKEKIAGNTNYWGVAAGGRFGVTDDMGIGVRGEVARAGTATNFNTLLWEVTATLDYALTDNLKTLLEVRYDRGALGGGSNSFFTKSNGLPTDADQTLALIQMMYTF
jgi:hypothetical protein